jgi:beta-glucosidase
MVKSLALIGPLADNQKELLGCWDCEGKTDEAVTVRKGLENKIPSKRIHYANGCDIDGSSRKEFAKAVEIAKRSDVAVVVVGESADMSGEAACRSSLGLPGVQRELVQAVHETDTPVVVVLMNGRPLSIPWIAEHVPAILETWQLGTQSGHAIADVIFGDVNPSGKLPITFPRTVGQVPIYYNYKNTGRPPGAAKYTSKYLDLQSTPLFPFGYGLSYTRFDYSDLKIETEREDEITTVSIHAMVRNRGEVYGEEVVQLYIQDVAASITRPVKELKGFHRVGLAPGERKNVKFEVTHEHLGFYDERMNYVVEPGLFKVWVGPNSIDGLEGHFEIRNGESSDQD